MNGAINSRSYPHIFIRSHVSVAILVRSTIPIVDDREGKWLQALPVACAMVITVASDFDLKPPLNCAPELVSPA